MTYEEKVEYLSQYRILTQRIDGLAAEKRRWKDIGQKVNVPITGMPKGTGNKSKVEASGTAIADINRQINLEMSTALKKRDMVKSMIDTKAVKLRARELLTMYFIYGLSYQAIADRLGKSPKTVQNAINKAIKEMDI